MSCSVAGPRSIVSAPLFDPVAGHDVSKACQGEHDRSQGVDGGRDARDDGPEADHEEERSVIPLPRAPRAEPLGPSGPLLTGMRLTPGQQPRERNLEARRHAQPPMKRKEGPPTHSATVPGHAVRPGVFGPRPPTRASVAPCSSRRIGASLPVRRSREIAAAEGLSWDPSRSITEYPPGV